MNPNPPSYTLFRNQLYPSWPITLFKWLLVIGGIGLFVGAIAWAIRDEQAWDYVGPMAIGVLYVFQWAKGLSGLPQSTDPNLPRRVSLYLELKDHAWAPTVSEMMAKLTFVTEDRKFLANPFTWNRKQRVLHGMDGDLAISLYEHNGVVGRVELSLQGPLLGT